MGIARVGAAGSRGVELSVGADGEGSRAVTACGDTALCCSWHTPGHLHWAARGVCDPALSGRVTGMWTAVGHIWVWMYQEGWREGMVDCPAGRVLVAWAAAHVQRWCSDQQSLHTCVVDGPH